MGWRAKVAGKLGNLLYDTLEAPLKIYNYTSRLHSASDDSQEISEDQNEEAHSEAVHSEEEREDFGPDTTSLTAFLISLLSSSDTSHHNRFEISNGSKDDVGSASTSKVQDILAEHLSDKCLYETDVSEVVVPSQNPQDGILKHLFETKTHSPKLPATSEDSVLFPDELRAFLYTALPNLVKGRLWVLLYSTARHGISLHTLYRRSAALPGPFLLVVGDFHGAVFGGLVTTPLKPTSKRKYNGTNEMFVFTNVHGTPKLFRATGLNRYYCLCTNDVLALGGGGHFALHLDEDLLNGSSGACETFGSTCLANSEDFSIANVEIWGFAHTSRYAALFREEMK